jgi:hypothetical protein
VSRFYRRYAECRHAEYCGAIIFTFLQYPEAESPYLRGRMSTVDLLVLTNSDLLVLILKRYIFFLQKEVILMGRSAVLSLPLLQGFPASSFKRHLMGETKSLRTRGCIKNTLFSS